VQAMETTNNLVKSEKTEVENKLSETLSLVEEKEDMIYDLEQASETMKKRFALQQMHFLTAGLKKHYQYLKELKLEGDAKVVAVETVRKQLESEKQPLLGQIRDLQCTINSYKNLLKLMQDTLVNHKRDVLMGHKSKSRELVAELQSIISKQEELDNQRNLLRGQMKSIEERLRSLEQEMEEHAKTSIIQDGRVNVAHAKKKRRLNDEYEKVIDEIESKREELTAVDENSRKFVQKKDETDGLMKSLERALVEVLVEQQKKLLEILSKSNSK